MPTLTTEPQATHAAATVRPGTDLAALKAGHKATWESGDFGQIARSIEPAAEEFMSRQFLRRGARVLDVACGTGNLAIIAVRQGCVVSGIDIAANLLAQARIRAARGGNHVSFLEADAEALPFANEAFDLAVSMFGVMFAPQPEVAVAELHRVTKPGGRIALANWTPAGFIGSMFNTFKAFSAFLPTPSAGIPSPMAWGDEPTVRARLGKGFANVRLTRHLALMSYPFSPAETVDFFRRYYGPTLRTFALLAPAAQAALHQELVELQTRHNIARIPGITEVAAEYLEVSATRI
ncbi:MAG TPA: methyltransferase domain-containing protein [Dongiaceae bacterium]|jgi:SAM-dependent methyltransferase|nr:methyltransferase domain-containing protein [Dongiaceae bacterium]